MTLNRRFFPAFALAAFGWVATGCATLPELDRLPHDTTGVAPRLLPLDQLLAQADATPRATETAADTLSFRAARLRARAALMRGPVHDAATRTRLGAAISSGKA